MNWNNIGFVICKPDAVYLNLEQEILSFLRKKGFKILGCKYVTITPDLCRLLYWNGEEVPSEWWWELEAEFFNLGESLCVLVQGTPEHPYESVSELIDRKWKGNNKPELARSGTIRHTFGSRNRIFNLFHSSDCTNAAKREAAIFFSNQKLERCLLKQNERRTLDITDIYFRVKQHFIESASIDHKVNKNYRNYIDEKKHQSMSVSNSKKQIWLYETLKEEYRMFNSDINENKLLKYITDYKNFKNLNYDTLNRAFIKEGLKLTKWEFCLLKTTMLVPPKNFLM